MKIICISGKIGMGKTLLSQKIIQNIHKTKFHKKYILYENIDDFVKNIHTKKQTNMKKLQKILFYSGSHKNRQTEMTWQQINKKFKPIIQEYIYKIITKNYKSYTYKIIIFDLALQSYCTEVIHKINIKNIKNINFININLKTNKYKSLYTQLFLLKKHRKISYKKSIKILHQQTPL